MQYAEILPLVEAEAKNPSTLGRGYTCGVSNVGVVKLPSLPKPVNEGWMGYLNKLMPKKDFLAVEGECDPILSLFCYVNH